MSEILDRIKGNKNTIILFIIVLTLPWGLVYLFDDSIFGYALAAYYWTPYTHAINFIQQFNINERLEIIAAIGIFLLLGALYTYIIKDLIHAIHDLKRTNLIKFIYVVIIVIFTIIVGEFLTFFKYDRYGDLNYTQTCLSAPESEGCKACQLGGEYLNYDDNHNFVVSEKVPSELRDDAQLCVRCENEYMDVEMDFDEISEACKQQK